jgi:hypothetical protein
MKIPHSNNKFNALQYHIHTSSEHQILGQGDGGYFPAELHAVHLEETGESYAVFGTMISVGAEPHDQFEWVLQGLEYAQQKVEDLCVESADDLADGESLQEVVTCPAIGNWTWSTGMPDYPVNEAPSLYELPSNPDFGTFTYKGGLTTPACTEIVNWNLLDTPMEISEDQMTRLVRLILCYVLPHFDEFGHMHSCGHGTVASASGSTSRPPQSLDGRQVIHRCKIGPNVVVEDIGTLAADDGENFVKPERVMEPSNTEEGACSRALFKDCSEDPRYNPEVSPNLKTGAEIWYDSEGFWVGTMSSTTHDGKPLGPVFASKNVENTVPYPRTDVMVFLNRTVSGTRYYEHSYSVYSAADESFCNLPLPDGATNTLGAGICGINGYATYAEKFGTATAEKDGSVGIFLANGRSFGSESGVAFPVSASTIYFSTAAVDDSSDDTGFQLSETQTFTNKDNTQITGSGQYLIFSDLPPYNEQPLAETFTYVLHQVSEDDYKSMLTAGYTSAKVPNSERIPLPSDDCIRWYSGQCPTESSFREHDPIYSESEYQDDPSIKGGFIALFVILGLVVLVGTFYYVQTQREKKQAERYQHIFARRVAATINFTGTHDHLTPSLLEAEFKRMDEDGDGVLSKKELEHFLGDNMDKRDFEAMFAAIDIDHNETIEFSEFCAFMSMIGKTYDEETKAVGHEAETDTEKNGSTEEKVINC